MMEFCCCVFTELDKQLEDAPLPLVVQHAAKLSGVRKRVQFLTHTLHVVKARIANMDRLISERGHSQPHGRMPLFHCSTILECCSSPPHAVTLHFVPNASNPLYPLKRASF